MKKQHKEKEFENVIHCNVREYKKYNKHSKYVIKEHKQSAECYKLGHSKFKYLVKDDVYDHRSFYKKNYIIENYM